MSRYRGCLANFQEIGRRSFLLSSYRHYTGSSRALGDLVDTFSTVHRYELLDSFGRCADAIKLRKHFTTRIELLVCTLLGGLSNEVHLEFDVLDLAVIPVFLPLQLQLTRWVNLLLVSHCS